MTGLAAFVLPSFSNARYIDVTEGEHFGFIDIVGSAQVNNFPIEDWYMKKAYLQRQFSIQAIENVEVQILSLANLHRMHSEFNQCYQ